MISSEATLKTNVKHLIEQHGVAAILWAVGILCEDKAKERNRNTPKQQRTWMKVARDCARNAVLLHTEC